MLFNFFTEVAALEYSIPFMLIQNVDCLTVSITLRGQVKTGRKKLKHSPM